MLAALSLFAASLGSQVRDRANQALVQRYLVQGRATGEAAIFLALQQIQQQGKRLGIQNVEVSFAGQTIAVHLQPWSGLVNINRATENLWTALLIGAAQLSHPQAQVLARAIVQQRQQQTHTPQRLHVHVQKIRQNEPGRPRRPRSPRGRQQGDSGQVVRLRE